MTGIAKGTGSVPLTDASAQAVETLLSSPDWQQRLAEARVQREKVLAERARLDDSKPGLTPPKKPWEREAPARPATRDRPRADAATVAAARADLLLPQVMRATRADIAAAAARPASAEVVPIDTPQRVPRDDSATDLERAMATATSAPKPPVAIRAPASQTATPTVAPLVAPDRRKARSLPLVIAAAFAAGMGLGGGLFLWVGSSNPATTAGGTAATPVAGPALSIELAALPVETAVTDTTAPTLTAMLRPDPRPGPAVLASPTAEDSPAPAYGSPAATSPLPVASPEFGIADVADVRLPQGLAAPHLTARPDEFVLAGQAEDRPPVAVPSLELPLTGAEAMLAALAVPATGETLSYYPEGVLAPLRLSLPALAFPVETGASGASGAAAGMADPAALAPPPAPRVLAGAGFAGVPVRLLTSPRAASDAEGAVERSLRDNGFTVAGIKPITHKINRTHVRYYHTEDQAAAEAVAATLGINARAFAPPGASAGPGTVEVWIGGPAPTEPATTAKAPLKAAAKAKKNKATASATARRNAEQEQLRALRDRIVLQLQSGG